MALYKIDSNISSYARAWGLDTGNKVIEANSEAEARRLAYTLTGIPAAALQVSAVPPGVPLAGGMSGLSGANVNLPPEALSAPANNNLGEVSSGNDAAFGTNLANIEGFNRAAPRPADGSFASFVGGVDQAYDPTGGAYSSGGIGGPSGAPPVIPNPISADLANQLAYANSQGNQGFGNSQGGQGFGIDPFYGEIYDPISADLRNQLDYANSQANAVPDFMTGAELDAAEAAQFALDQRKRDDQLREEQKQASLVSGPVRSWDAKLADITVNPDGTVTLPADMWRNAKPAGVFGAESSTIGRDQIEDAIRKIAELGGRDSLDRSVSNMLQQARSYYSSTPRGDGTWDRNIDSGLIDGKLLSDAGFKATWGSLADEVLGARKAAVEGQIPKETGGSGVTNPWADTNPDGFLSLSAAQQKYVIDNNLPSMQEYDAFYRAEQASKVPAIDPIYGESSDGPNGFDAEALYDVGKDVGVGDPLPKFTTKGFDFSGADDGLGGTNGGAGKPGDPTGLAGTGNEDMFIAGAMQGFPAPPAPPAPPAFDGAGGSFPALSSQDMIDDEQGYLTAAGQRLAFKNVYGDAATGVGPLASYLQRQTYPLTQAYRAASFANMGREQAGDVYPKTTFEDFLRTVQQKPTGLSGAFGQTLQDVNYLRGLGGSQVPAGLEGVFNPEQAANTRDARALLEAAQRGKYSRLVSRSFRQPSENDLFSDYVLAKQDATTAGTVPQNFFNFAASRYGV